MPRLVIGGFIHPNFFLLLVSCKNLSTYFRMYQLVLHNVFRRLNTNILLTSQVHSNDREYTSNVKHTGSPRNPRNFVVHRSIVFSSICYFLHQVATHLIYPIPNKFRPHHTPCLLRIFGINFFSQVNFFSCFRSRSDAWSPLAQDFPAWGWAVFRWMKVVRWVECK